MTKADEPQWTAAAIEQAAEKLLRKLNPHLETDGEKALAIHLAQMTAAVLQLQEQVAVNHRCSEEATNLALEVRSRLTTGFAAIAGRLEDVERR